MDNDGNREKWFWITSGGAAVTIVSALYVAATSGLISVNALPRQEFSQHAPGGIEVMPRPPEQVRPERSDLPISTVFECMKDGQRIFSDRRCGPSVEVRVIGPSNRMDRQDTSILSTPEAVLARSQYERQDAEMLASDTHQAECQALEQEKDSINARMRSGYTSPQGEWFRERLRTIGDRYYNLRCRHFH